MHWRSCLIAWPFGYWNIFRSAIISGHTLPCSPKHLPHLIQRLVLPSPTNVSFDKWVCQAYCLVSVNPPRQRHVKNVQERAPKITRLPHLNKSLRFASSFIPMNIILETPAGKWHIYSAESISILTYVWMLYEQCLSVSHPSYQALCTVFFRSQSPVIEVMMIKVN